MTILSTWFTILWLASLFALNRMMDIPSYRDKAYNKLKTYGEYGIIPSPNLITTFETQNHPINSSEIERLIAEHFM